MDVKKELTVFGCLLLGIFLLFGYRVSTLSIKNGELAKDDAKTRIYIPIISKGWQHQYWQSVKMGAKKAAKDYNIRITFEAPEADIAVNKQIEMIDSALSRNPDALVLSAVNSKAVIHELEKAKSLNIPVIGFDSGVDSDILVTTVSTDNTSAGSLAAELLSNSNKPILKIASRIAHEHHEKYDGTGYPRGISGEEIGVYARIVALTDVFDALGTERVYKEKWEWDKIIDYIKEQRGKQFDPKIVDIFLENLDEIRKIKDSLKD
jgi:DNA-binding LacI/PurR family transcriptional regulator